MSAKTETRADYQEQIERLLASHVFHNADSLRRLLGYLGEKSLHGVGGELKEYTVGVEAFGKSADYNPQADASVRVQASKLRQKLEEYYRTEGAADSIKVSFPKGGFQLFFHTEPVAQAESVAPVLPAESEAIRRWQLCSLALLVLLVVVVVFAARWRMQITPRPPAAEWEASAWTPEMAVFWQPYLQSNRPVLLSLGTPLFARFESGFFRDSTLNEWEEAQQSSRLRDLQSLLQSREPAPSYIYTGVGEATALLLLHKSFLAARREPQVKRSNLLSWEDIANNNLIFVGSHKYNRHLRDLPVTRAFVIDIDGGEIRNLHPAPGESAIYGRLRGADRALIECHALISRFPGLHGRGEITIIESPATEGAWAAAIYLTSADHITDLVNRLRQSSGHLAEKLPGAFQAIIKVNLQTQVPVQISYVTHRVL